MVHTRPASQSVSQSVECRSWTVLTHAAYTDWKRNTIENN
jgi:hypothetical protein